MPPIVEPDAPDPYAHPGGNASTVYDFHDRTVSRQLVHRACVSEVLLTGWRATGPYDFLLGAQWPRLHGHYRLPGGRCHDPVLIAETVRQAALLIGHAGFGVPRDHRFALTDLSYGLGEGGLPGLAVTPGPASLMLAARCEDVRMHQGRLASLRVRAEITRDGRPVGHGDGQLRVLTPASYALLRPRPALRPAAAEPGAGGAVLAPTLRPDTWLLRPEAEHPVLFDAGQDHVPGMLVLEAARQAAQLLRPEPVVPVELVTSFERYIEPDRPCLVRAVHEGLPREGRRGPVLVRFVQDGRTAAECRLLVEPAGSDARLPLAG
ncbi:ScbA/BarX family gamma-butyrolactone biosynthesis protein [Kitasatospora sp. NPDC101183]|uniref:ScbA/BarX family gamma-butyrolactone biosynthesis protein n=1 Tax=Kitasatospora sp. NPDC101183 TaxID=3364100 RepID=UPI0037F50E3A